MSKSRIDRINGRGAERCNYTLQWGAFFIFGSSSSPGCLSCGRGCSPSGLFVLIIFPYANVVLFNCGEASDEHGEERGEDKLIIDSGAIFLEAIAITWRNPSFPCINFSAGTRRSVNTSSQHQSVSERERDTRTSEWVFCFSDRYHSVKYVFIAWKRGLKVVVMRQVKISHAGYRQPFAKPSSFIPRAWNNVFCGEFPIMPSWKDECDCVCGCVCVLVIEALHGSFQVYNTPRAKERWDINIAE